jgi:hypothetical protein
MITFTRLIFTILFILFYMPQSKRGNIIILLALDADLTFILGWSEAKRAVITTNRILFTSYLLLTFYTGRF